jgi:hypothetical protein
LALARARQRSINTNETLILAPLAQLHRVAVSNVTRCRRFAAAFI